MEEIPKPKFKPKGQSKEVLLELSKKGVEVVKEKAIISAYERKKIKEEQTRLRKEKVEMILKEKEKLEKGEPIEEPKEEEPPQEEEPKIKKEKKKRIVEVIEEIEEEESSSEEEEVIIRRVIKRVPKKREDLYDLSNQDLLKRKLYENTKKRLMNDLFN